MDSESTENIASLFDELESVVFPILEPDDFSGSCLNGILKDTISSGADYSNGADITEARNIPMQNYGLDMPSQLKWLSTNKGGKKLVDNSGYIYRFSKTYTSKDGNVKLHFVCEETHCNSTAIVQNDVIILAGDHVSHPPFPEKALQASVRGKIRETIKNQPCYARPRAVMSEIYSNTGVSVDLPKHENLVRLVRREIAKKSGSSISKNWAMFKITDKKKLTCDGKRFMLFDSGNG